MEVRQWLILGYTSSTGISCQVVLIVVDS